MSDHAELVTGWIAHHARREMSSGEFLWAWEAMRELARQDPVAAWAVTLDLIRAAPDDRLLADIAAGPLEQLIQESHATLMDRVETAARQDPKFRRCLTGVWLGAKTPAAVRDRVAKYTSTVTDALLMGSRRSSKRG
jgi:hypothetical protein